MLGLYRKLSTRAPLGVAFATCFVKGSASDAVSQQVVEQRPALDVQRNTAFAFFSGAYLGCGQHFVYNVAFTRAFGPGRSAGVAACKVLADAIVHVPCVYLPLYYAFETPALGKGSPLDGLVRYREDAYDVLTTYWSTWPAVHFISFTMLPPEVRTRPYCCRCPRVAYHLRDPRPFASPAPHRVRRERELFVAHLLVVRESQTHRGAADDREARGRLEPRARYLRAQLALEDVPHSV